MFFHEGNNRRFCHPYSVGPSTPEKKFRAVSDCPHSVIFAAGQRRTIFRPKIENQYLHPIDGALLEQTAERGRGAFTLAADNEDHRQLGRIRFSLSILCSRHVRPSVYQARNVGGNAFGIYLT
jgi:hypothetical protein